MKQLAKKLIDAAYVHECLRMRVMLRLHAFGVRVLMQSKHINQTSLANWLNHQFSARQTVFNCKIKLKSYENAFACVITCETNAGKRLQLVLNELVR